jgi:hypothetical protein
MLVWPLVSLAGFVVLSGLVVVLATGSTARYEFERNQVQRRQQAERPDPVPADESPRPAPVGVAAPAPAADPSPAPAPAGLGDEQPAGRPGGAGQSAAVAVATLPATVPMHLPLPTPAPVPVSAAHPAGRRIAGDGRPVAWWLITEDADQPRGRVVAGPFPDRVEAEWAAVAAAPGASTEVVHGVRDDQGRVLRRQSPQERAWLADLGAQLDRLPGDWDDRLDDDDDALVTLVVEIAAGLVEAGLQLHDCAGDGSTGGVCLTPEPGRGGVLVSWHQHDRMSRDQVRGTEAFAAVQCVMEDAVSDCLTELGFQVEGFGTSGSSLVTAAREW